MNYITFTAGGKEYKLRLNTRAAIQLEKTIGCNPLSIFGDGETIPTITVMVAVLHASLTQLNHGITLANAYDIFDEWLAEGNAMTDFISIILEIYKASGLIKTGEEAEKN